MRLAVVMILVLVGGLSIAALDRAPQQPAPAKQYFIAIFSRGTAWDDKKPANEQTGFKEHSENLRRLDSLRPQDARAELKLLLEYAPEAGVTDVPDPYYGGANGFERVLDLVEQGSRGLLDEIRRRHKA